MYTQETQSKYYLETISIYFPFDDVFVGGETITGTPSISVVVYAGIDATPSDILYQGASITNGDKVEQRVRLGVPGNIYIVTCSIKTTSNNYYEKETYLAIIPTDGTAIPEVSGAYFSSTLYPYEYTESLQGSVSINGGRLYQQVWTTSESLGISTTTLTSGSLVIALVTYNYSYESLQGSITILGGNLAGGGITYSNTYESLRGAIAIIGGSLNNSGITHSYSHESFTGSISLTGGTLA